jgi:pyruvate formate lyase activating enzyme
MQGCNLRCGCCHNPDTWECGIGNDYTVLELAEKIERYRSYFGKDGGVTVSGGEPLLQSEFVTELFKECKKRGINTCLDTSGDILNDSVKALLTVTDRVLLDVKYNTDELYRRFVGCPISKPLEFLRYLDEQSIPTTLRQVIIPTLNENGENIDFLNSLIDKYKCIDKIELLPFKKICKVKYDKMNMEFPFDKYETPSQRLIDELYGRLKI